MQLYVSWTFQNKIQTFLSHILCIENKKWPEIDFSGFQRNHNPDQDDFFAKKAKKNYQISPDIPEEIDYTYTIILLLCSNDNSNKLNLEVIMNFKCNHLENWIKV